MTETPRIHWKIVVNVCFWDCMFSLSVGSWLFVLALAFINHADYAIDMLVISSTGIVGAVGLIVIRAMSEMIHPTNRQPIKVVLYHRNYFRKLSRDIFPPIAIIHLGHWLYGQAVLAGKVKQR